MDIEEIYDGYVEKVYKFFYIKCLDRDIAEDLTSATFMSYLERVEGSAAVIDDKVKYLYGIMRNTWLTYLRDKYRKHELVLESMDDFEGYASQEIEEFEDVSVKERAARVIALLPEKQREIVSLRLLEELSIKEISNHFGKDVNYVKTTYKRGFRRLKQLVESQEHFMHARKENL